MSALGCTADEPSVHQIDVGPYKEVKRCVTSWSNTAANCSGPSVDRHNGKGLPRSMIDDASLTSRLAAIAIA